MCMRSPHLTNICKAQQKRFPTSSYCKGLWQRISNRGFGTWEHLLPQVFHRKENGLKSFLFHSALGKCPPQLEGILFFFCKTKKWCRCEIKRSWSNERNNKRRSLGAWFYPWNHLKDLTLYFNRHNGIGWTFSKPSKSRTFYSLDKSSCWAVQNWTKTWSLGHLLFVFLYKQTFIVRIQNFGVMDKWA